MYAYIIACFSVDVCVSGSSIVLSTNTQGWEFGFRLTLPNRRRCYLSWKKKTYMDPTQAMTHISQRMWHDQGPSSLSISLRTHTIFQLSLWFAKLRQIYWLVSRDPPGRVGGSYEEVNCHSVTHVETLLHLPKQWKNRASTSWKHF